MTFSVVMRFMLNRFSLIGLALACGLAAAACASVAPEAPLSETRWVVQSINGQPAVFRTPTLEFAADRVSGTGGCNRYFGGYAVNGERLIFSGVGSTEMACEQPVMAQESAFHAALGAVRFYRRDGETLVLEGEGESDLLILRAAN
ncbi:MAG: META domain-containing protein [Caulobacterales bacterium]|jgi:heat shock protein HslJ|nr:META domain-containing protein [Caulobacterales bacterium]